ncbi:hypothetical protein BACCAP_03954 [Pseudoflavonifractor capillosus ATCC 29799]|uniref:Uncharacterized protein n=1 Tax=Pseudoflavonifractor capillosus ATCC 29799 TaxID=411467 RepID=A6P0E3_9FIRM|nr:hypothetical protein BACCAP_03954 [Pseudoflavonifractor capillosus ATCC 29799]
MHPRPPERRKTGPGQCPRPWNFVSGKFTSRHVHVA